MSFALEKRVHQAVIELDDKTGLPATLLYAGRRLIISPDGSILMEAQARQDTDDLIAGLVADLNLHVDSTLLPNQQAVLAAVDAAVAQAAIATGAAGTVQQPANLPAGLSLGVLYLVRDDNSINGGITPTVSGAGGGGQSMWKRNGSLAGENGWGRETRPSLVRPEVPNVSAGPDEINKPVSNADLELGTVVYQQIFELYKNPPGVPLAALGGAFLEPWSGFEWVALNWLDARKHGAGEYWLTVEVYGAMTNANPLTVRLLNTAFAQSLDLTIGDVVDDLNAGAGIYRTKRSSSVKLSEITNVGRRALNRMKVQIAAPSGGVEIFELRLIVEWRR